MALLGDFMDLSKFRAWMQENGMSSSSIDVYSWAVASAHKNYLPYGKKLPAISRYAMKKYLLFQEVTREPQSMCAVPNCTKSAELELLAICIDHARVILKAKKGKVPASPAGAAVHVWKDHVLLLDSEDYEKYKNKRIWYSTGNWRICIYARDVVSLPKLIMGITNDKSKGVFYRNGDNSDLRKENLEVWDADSAARVPYRGRTGHQNTYVKKNSNGWCARVKIGGRLVTRSFSTRSEAAQEAKRMRLEAHGRNIETIFPPDVTNEVIFRDVAYPSLAEVVRQFGQASEELVRSRISKGWSIERAVLTPTKPIGRPRFLDAD